MKTLLIVADVYHGESKLFYGKDFTVLQESFLIKDSSAFDEAYKVFSKFSEVILIADSEASTLAGKVKRLAIIGGFNGLISGVVCENVSDIPMLLAPENIARFDIVKPANSSWPSLKKNTVTKAKEVFPTHCLPEAAREFVKAVSEATSTPPDFAAAASLAVMAGAIGAAARLEVKSGWYSYAVLWVAFVAPAGKTKSPVLSYVSKPLQEIQAELNARFQQATKNHDPEKDGEKPNREVLVYNDTTQEALLKSLANSQRGGVQISDELSGWLGSHNKYSKGGGNDRQNYLTLWSSEPLSVLRKSDGMAFIPLPVLSQIGAMTPSSLPSLHGGAEDGFLSRFLVSYPDTRKQVWADDGVSTGAQYAWTLFIKHLWNLEPETNGGGVWLPATVKLSAEARELIKKFYNDLQEVIDSGTVPSLFIGSWSKAPLQASRIALILHLGRQAGGEEPVSNLVGVDTMEAAIQITNYFLGQLAPLETSFNSGASRAESVCQNILGWLKRWNAKHPNRPANQKKLKNDCRSALSNGALIDNKLLEQTLETLDDQGFIKLQPVESIAGRTSKDLILINPNL